MGQEIKTIHFSQRDFEEYHQCLQSETRLLSQWFAEEAFSTRSGIGGYELEIWLVDRDFHPAPINEAYLKRLGSDWVSPELSRFNIELNCLPRSLQGHALSQFQQDLENTWQECQQVAKEFDASLVMTGILPSVQEKQLTLENMSQMKRYHALNEQVIRQRQGKPLQLDIVGQEHLRTIHHDVMLESATTSFQVHLQVAASHAARAYNASLIASAATIAISGNSPYLFGKCLWEETRIPLFEQAVAIGGYDGAAFGPIRRVSFGSGYARNSLMEVFQENLDHFPVLLPMLFDSAAEELQHLRLHNGTIWRWNRPLIGFDEDGTPHLRIEHRVVSAGPTMVDDIATSALYFGLVYHFMHQADAPEQSLEFSTVRDNFYNCAKYGLNAHVCWLNEQRGQVKNLLQQQLLPQAREGLSRMGMAADEIAHYVGILEERVATGQTGSAWQRAWVAEHGANMNALTAAYAENMSAGRPVHTWTI